jgi:hypothetical protein
MDEETRNWPIPAEFADEFDGIKYNYEADLLPLYHDGHLVEPSDTNAVINGAIVEVHFGIRHWRIADFDSFQANVEKIHILRPAPIHHTSNYKRPHPADNVKEPEVKKSRTTV